nr:MAG TPA: hypothetical protein [Crassvirales sp.]
MDKAICYPNSSLSASSTCYHIVRTISSLFPMQGTRVRFII